VKRAKTEEKLLYMYYENRTPGTQKKSGKTKNKKQKSATNH